MRETWRAIDRDLKQAPEQALSIFENATTSACSPLVGETLQQAWSTTMECIARGRDIEKGVAALDAIAARYGEGRRVDRQLLVQTAVDKLYQFGVTPHARTCRHHGLAGGSVSEVRL